MDNEFPDRKISKIITKISVFFSFSRFYLALPYVVICGVVLSIYIFYRCPSKGADQLGNAIIMAGAVLIARGVVQSRELNKFLSDLYAQEMVMDPYRPLQIKHILYRNWQLANFMDAGFPPSKIANIYKKKLNNRGYYLDEHDDLKDICDIKRKMISQKDIAKLFKDASKYAEAGTVLIVFGTFWIMGCAFFK